MRTNFEPQKRTIGSKMQSAKNVLLWLDLVSVDIGLLSFHIYFYNNSVYVHTNLVVWVVVFAAYTHFNH
jgi:hypothetical protein